MVAPDSATIAANLTALRARIEAVRGDPSGVSIVAVAKRFDASAVAAALEAGLVDIGQSYAQELLAVASDLDAESSGRAISPRWHFVGRVQRNKVARIAPLVTCWHSVDRAEVGDAIARATPGATVLVQVNTTGEAQKGGCEPDAAAGLVATLRRADLDVRGLMTVGPTTTDIDATRRAFRLLRTLADDLDLPERSMGMSGDLDVALEEGSTIVRVGTALFGPRRSETTVEH